MNTYRYLIVGGGMTAHAAAAAIREVDPSGTIGMIAVETEPPYARPPLSKGLWFGKPESKVFLPPVQGLQLHQGRRAVFLDARTREVRDDAGELHRGHEVLLATGARPRRLPYGGDRVIYFRTLQDFRRLRATRGDRVVVIGAGFIGTEVASALAQNGRRVDLVFPDTVIGARLWPADLAQAVTRTFEAKGVRLHARDAVVAIEPRGDETVVRTAGGHALVADAVVAGIGVNPDVELADAAGLKVSDGIEVDDRLQTSAKDVFAAGDVARFPCAALGERVRIEHEDAALSMGRAAGRIMAGQEERYDHLPFFYSDVFDYGYEAVGKLDARLETVASWKTPFREGVVYYLDRGEVKGVLLWGIFGQVDAARELISRHAPVKRDELRDAIHA